MVHLSKRMERIFTYVQEQTAHLTEDDIHLGKGVTTKEIAEALELQRSNVSKDLNQLVRLGRTKKIEGRPVRYIDARIHWHQPLKKHVKSYMEKPVVKPATLMKETDIFQRIIGASGSMKNAVEQAKAAILYPPKGLNCLITGPTGSGKSYFAHAMFQFAQVNGIIAEDKELVVFNCADYAHNPELLMSHLFGYVQGAFTGATTDKDGIIQKANGGMLFLDEIHRLPPEGQEMIFYFMDHGTYHRLGETMDIQQADVRIVGATTEDPSSALLATFVRRIPINIQMPAFTQRPAREQVDLVKIMVALEANRIQRRISMTEDVVKALIGSVSYGNIGQLKSNIQLVCARGFLNHMTQEEVTIVIEDLSENLRGGLIQLAANRGTLSDLSQFLEPKMVVYPNDGLMRLNSDSYELPYNLYDIIGDKAAILKADGLDQEAINNFITTDINIHLESFYKNHGFTFDTEKKLSEFVDQRIIDLTNEIYDIVTEHLDGEFHHNFLYAMSLHISSFLKRLHSGDQRHINDNIKQMADDFPQEFAVARIVRQKIETSLATPIPQSEEYYLTVLLVSLRKQGTGRIGVVVAAHGNSTASSMVQVVKQLLGADHVKAVDMPLEMHPRTALDKIVAAILEVSEGSGAMLLVDMGSLSSFTEEIQQRVGQPVRTIDMVTTAVVLETVRKTSVIGTDIEELYQSLRHFHGYVDTTFTPPQLETSQKHKAIAAVCASGEGTARRIKEIIETQLDDGQIKVFSISVVDMHRELAKIQQRYDLTAVTGIKDPEIEVPFIPLEDFFNGQAQDILEQIRQESQWLTAQRMEVDEETARRICVEYMNDNFTFINPLKVIDALWQYATVTDEHYLGNSQGFSFRINFVMHMAGVLERALRQDPLSVTDEAVLQTIYEPNYKELVKGVVSLEEQFRLAIPAAERYYIAQLVDAVAIQ